MSGEKFCFSYDGPFSFVIVDKHRFSPSSGNSLAAVHTLFLQLWVFVLSWAKGAHRAACLSIRVVLLWSWNLGWGKRLNWPDPQWSVTMRTFYKWSWKVLPTDRSLFRFHDPLWSPLLGFIHASATCQIMCPVSITLFTHPFLPPSSPACPVLPIWCTRFGAMSY